MDEKIVLVYTIQMEKVEIEQTTGRVGSSSLIWSQGSSDADTTSNEIQIVVINEHQPGKLMMILTICSALHLS